MAPVCQYAELLQSTVSGGGERDAAVLSRYGGRMHPGKPQRAKDLSRAWASSNSLNQWSPIARGALARPWTSRSTPRESSDKFLHHLVRSKENEIDHAIVDRVEEIAKKKGVPMAAVATAWCLSKEGVNPIIGLGSTQRIDEAVQAVKLKLTEEEIRSLEEVYAPKVIAGY